MSYQHIFVDGAGYEKPSDKAPKSIVGKLSISVPRFTEFMNKNKNDRNWVNIDIRYSEEKGKFYMTLNNYNSDITAKDRKEIADKKVENGYEPMETPETDTIQPEEIPF